MSRYVTADLTRDGQESNVNTTLNLPISSEVEMLVLTRALYMFSKDEEEYLRVLKRSGEMSTATCAARIVACQTLRSELLAMREDIQGEIDGLCVEIHAEDITQVTALQFAFNNFIGRLKSQGRDKVEMVNVLEQSKSVVDEAIPMTA